MQAKLLEQQQLIGYWAKTQGFSLQALERADIDTLQALRLATNCLKRRQLLDTQEIQTFSTLINNYNTGKTISKELLNAVFRKARKIQRKEAKLTRKATR